MCERENLCIYVCERERMRCVTMIENVCVCKKEKERMCVCMYRGKRERESLCLCV